MQHRHGDAAVTTLIRGQSLDNGTDEGAHFLAHKQL